MEELGGGDENISLTASVESKKKDKDRRKGKGRRFYMWGRIYSIPCRASDLNYRLNCTR